MKARLGIDVGGTFTDVIVSFQDGTVLVDKVPSTPQDPSVGVLAAVERLRSVHGIDTSDLDLFAHGSTVATNALLEAKLPRTALLVTGGFRDVLEIAGQDRPALFDLRVTKPGPLIERNLVIEVDERIDRAGEVVRALTDAEIERVCAQLESLGVQTCAVSLLFGFRNPVHEEALAEAIRTRLPGVYVATSSRIAPELGEYSRTNTTAVAATLIPLVAGYVGAIESGLVQSGTDVPLFIMQSSGGLMTAGEASYNAHKMILSGPAAGALASARLADRAGYRDQITFDMGGTSTDICLIHDARVRLERETIFEGRPIKVPQYDIHTIGSGGGSVARVDEAGLLRVGPESMGAMPGPACYMRGGTQATTTDAQLVLGRVDPARFLGGEMELSVEEARTAVQTHVADKLGISVEEAALGILDVANAVMARGVRVVSVNRGFDPRDFSLLAFGGAGAMHAVDVARIADVPRVIVPTTPGAFSALGLATADLRYDHTLVVDRAIDTLTGDDVEALYARLIDGASAQLSEIEGAAGFHARFVRVAHFRYAWQDNYVEILLGEQPVDDDALTDALAEFHRKHEFEYGHSDPADAVELLSVSIEAVGTFETMGAAPVRSSGLCDAPVAQTRNVCFAGAGWVSTAVIDRADLTAGMRFVGPAIVEEREATTVVPPGTAGEVDDWGNIILTIEQGGTAS